MKKIISVAVAVLAAASLAVPAHVDNDSDFGGGVNAAGNWNFTAATVSLTEKAVAPVLGGWVGDDHANNASNGNIIDHS